MMSGQAHDAGAPGAERLIEVRGARQPAGDPPRRWFSCASADLYLWYRDADCIAFEFCYGKPEDERSLRWRRDGGTLHSRIDDGEASPRENRTPIAIAIDDEDYDAERAALEFERVATGLEPRIYRLVLKALHG